MPMPAGPLRPRLRPFLLHAVVALEVLAQDLCADEHESANPPSGQRSLLQADRARAESQVTAQEEEAENRSVQNATTSQQQELLTSGAVAVNSTPLALPVKEAGPTSAGFSPTQFSQLRLWRTIQEVSRVPAVWQGLHRVLWTPAGWRGVPLLAAAQEDMLPPQLEPAVVATPSWEVSYPPQPPGRARDAALPLVLRPGHWHPMPGAPSWRPAPLATPLTTPLTVTGCLVYLVLVASIAYFYVRLGYRTQALQAGASTKPPGIEDLPKESFHFGIFDVDGCCGRDASICLCGWICPAIRWADTLSQGKLQFNYGFWSTPGRSRGTDVAATAGLLSHTFTHDERPVGTLLLLFSLCFAMDEFTMGVSGVVLITIGVYGRQRLRSRCGLPHSNIKTCCSDAILWICCGVCAVVQEAREVEYISVPVDIP